MEYWKNHNRQGVSQELRMMPVNVCERGALSTLHYSNTPSSSYGLPSGTEM